MGIIERVAAIIGFIHALIRAGVDACGNACDGVGEILVGQAAESTILVEDTVALLAKVSLQVIDLVVPTADLVGEGRENPPMAILASLRAVDEETRRAAHRVFGQQLPPIANIIGITRLRRLTTFGLEI